MSILYVFGPVHIEIHKLLHTISHGLEMPDFILGHQTTSGSHTNIHKSETHKNIAVYHDHKVITLVDKILEGSDQNNDNSDIQTIIFKIDKHITHYTDNPEESFTILSLETIQPFLEQNKKVCKGYLQGFKKPPKV